MLRGRPRITPPISRACNRAITCAASSPNFLRLMVSSGVATDRNRSETATPMVRVPRSSPASAVMGARAAVKSWMSSWIIRSGPLGRSSSNCAPCGAQDVLAPAFGPCRGAGGFAPVFLRSTPPDIYWPKETLGVDLDRQGGSLDDPGPSCGVFKQVKGLLAVGKDDLCLGVDGTGLFAVAQDPQ